MISEDEGSNFQLFRDCLSTPLIEKSTGEAAKKKRKLRNGRKTAIKPVASSLTTDERNDAEELADFIDVCISFMYLNSTDQTSISRQRSLARCHPNCGS